MRRLTYQLAWGLAIAVLWIAAAAAAPSPLPRDKPALPPLWNLFNQAQYTAAKSAINAARKGDWLRAQGWATATGEPVFRDVVTWLYLKDKKATPPLTEVTRFIARHPDWPLQHRILRTAERSAVQNASRQEADAWFAAHPPSSAKARRRQAENQIAAGQHKTGRQALRDVWRDGGVSKADARSYRRKYGSLLSRADHEARLSSLLWSRRRSEAKALLADVSTAARKIANVRMALQRRAKRADRNYTALPASALADSGLLYDRVRYLRKRDRRDDAIALFLAAPPQSADYAEKWWTERHILARYALSEGRGADAYALVQDHGLKAGRKYAEAEWFLGWVALRFGNRPAVALGHFQPVYDQVGTPISLSRFAYWTGRSEEALGNPDKARSWYEKAARHPIAYYGQLASLRLGQTSLSFPPDPVPTPADVQAINASPLVRAARLLDELGERDFAVNFLFASARAAKTPGEHFLLRALTAELNLSERMVRVGKIGISGGITLVDSAWPLYGFPPTLNGGPVPELAFIHAVSRQESELNPSAISPAGARGLMQLMPKTAKAVAKRQGTKYRKDWLIGDPVYNARLGMAHLQELANRYNGSYILMLSAYNAGPRRADQWSVTYGDPRYPGTDVVDWVESIPFSETRNYVQRIIESVQVYRARLTGNVGTLQTVADLRRGS